jgi:hypothetical protein
MSELNIEAFNPTVAELQRLADQSRAVDTTDLKAVKETRLEMKKARVEISKKGKEMRDGANAFAKAVIAKEKELIAIIEPEEERLEAVEEEAKAAQLREERKAILPHRKERLASLNDGIEVEDEELLDMDGPAFEGYFNKRMADKNEADRAEIARQQAEQDAAAKALEDEKNARDREEKARKDERESIEREQKEKEEREAKEKAEAEAKELADKEAAEKAEADRKAKLEADEKYRAFLTENGVTKELVESGEYLLKDKSESIELYKRVSIFTK